MSRNRLLEDSIQRKQLRSKEIQVHQNADEALWMARLSASSRLIFPNRSNIINNTSLKSQSSRRKQARQSIPSFTLPVCQPVSPTLNPRHSQLYHQPVKKKNQLSSSYVGKAEISKLSKLSAEAAVVTVPKVNNVGDPTLPRFVNEKDFTLPSQTIQPISSTIHSLESLGTL